MATPAEGNSSSPMVGIAPPPPTPRPIFSLLASPQLRHVVFDCLNQFTLFKDCRLVSKQTRKQVASYCEEEGAEMLVRMFAKKFRGERELEIESERQEAEDEALKRVQADRFQANTHLTTTTTTTMGSASGSNNNGSKAQEEGIAKELESFTKLFPSNLDTGANTLFVDIPFTSLKPPGLSTLHISSESQLLKLHAMLKLVNKGAKKSRQLFEHRVLSLYHREECEGEDEIEAALDQEDKDRFSNAAEGRHNMLKNTNGITLMLLPVEDFAAPNGKFKRKQQLNDDEWTAEATALQGGGYHNCWLDNLWISPLHASSTDIGIASRHGATQTNYYWLSTLRPKLAVLTHATIALSPSITMIPPGFLTICTNLREARFENCQNIQVMGDRAFRDLLNLKDLEFDDLSSLLVIGKYVLSGTGLKQLTKLFGGGSSSIDREGGGTERRRHGVPKLQIIGDSFLDSSLALEICDLTAPSLTSVGDHFLANCERLQTIRGGESWKKLRSIGDHAFTRTYRLETIQPLNLSPNFNMKFQSARKGVSDPFPDDPTAREDTVIASIRQAQVVAKQEKL